MQFSVNYTNFSTSYGKTFVPKALQPFSPIVTSPVEESMVQMRRIAILNPCSTADMLSEAMVQSYMLFVNGLKSVFGHSIQNHSTEVISL